MRLHAAKLRVESELRAESELQVESKLQQAEPPTASPDEGPKAQGERKKESKKRKRRQQHDQDRRQSPNRNDAIEQCVCAGQAQAAVHSKMYSDICQLQCDLTDPNDSDGAEPMRIFSDSRGALTHHDRKRHHEG